MPLLYQAFRRALTVAVDLYFVDVQSKGDDNVPDKGPVVFVANHPNSLMDTVLLGSRTTRSIHFMARSGLFTNPVVSTLFRSSGVIPVYRAQDSADGAGAKNDSMFDAAFEVLEQGDAIGIFPEGQNAPAHHVRDIKTGAARIALGAEARNDFGLGVRVVPVGLNYVERDSFHTAALVRFGEPIDVRAYGAQYAEDDRAAVRALTDEIQAAMRTQAVHIHDERNTQLVKDILAIYGDTILEEVLGSTPDLRLPQAKLLDDVTARDARGEDLDDRFTAQQGIADALVHFEEHHPEVPPRIRRRVRHFKATLEQLRLQHDFTERSPKGVSTRREVLKIIAYALLLGPIAMYGLVHNFVPYRLTRMAALRAPDEPIRAVTALGGGLFIFGLFYAFYGWLAHHGTASVLGASVYVATLPFAGFWFFRYRRRLAQMADRVKLRTLFRRQKVLYERAVLDRQLLLTELDGLRLTYTRERDAMKAAEQSAVPEPRQAESS